VIGKEDAESQIQQVLVELRRLLPPTVVQDAPYRGLLTFQEDDADTCFGRDA